MNKKEKNFDIQINNTVMAVPTINVEDALKKALAGFKEYFKNENRTEEPMYLIKIKSENDAATG